MGLTWTGSHGLLPLTGPLGLNSGLIFYMMYDVSSSRAKRGFVSSSPAPPTMSSSSSSAAAAGGAGSGEPSSETRPGKEREEGGDGGDVDFDLSGAAAGWVEARTSCPHLPAMPAAGADDLARVPPPDSPCSRCHHPAENWLCLICKDVLCSRFINKHMLYHYQDTGHCLALSFSDLSVWCFACDSYLDVQSILELRPVYEVAHLMKFGQRPPFRSLDVLDLSSGQNGGSPSQS